MTVVKYLDEATGQWLPIPFAPPATDARIVGEVVGYAGASAPPGWLVCDGAQYDTVAYPDLYAVLGTGYLPNLSGRSIIGPGAGVPLLGQGGVSTHTHVGNALAAHTHSDPATASTSDSHAHAVNPAAFTSGSGGSHSHTTGSPLGGSADHADGIEPSAAYTHTHSTNSAGAHTHSIDVPSTNSGTYAHTHTTPAHNVTSVGAGTPSVQQSNSYHPVLALNYIIFAG